MQPNNTGSFGSATGGMSPELAAAMQRRAGGNPSGPMGQVSQGAPTANPATQVPNSAPASINVPSQSSPSGDGMGLPTNTPESQLIIKALDQRLRSLSKVQEGGGTI